MKNFDSYDDYTKFENYIKRQNRYYIDKNSSKFLEILLETSGKRTIILSKDKHLWRSQLGNSISPYYKKDKLLGELPSPLPPDRMKPLTNEAKEGRANPKGIPYLYLSTDKKTAMAEVRPWVGALISVGQFRLLKDLKIVDFSQDNESYFLALIKSRQFTPEKIEKLVWSDINRAFSNPINPNDRSADYAPTQIIAEVFKNNGFDGVAFKSSLGEGFNLGLFALDSAEQVNCYICRMEKVKYFFQNYGEPYSLKSKQNKANKNSA